MNDKKRNLKMTFDPNVINHLGIQMYSTLPPVIAELIANSYDAEAEKVEIYLYDKDEKKIVIKDFGHGMTFDEINEKFLKVGRNRRIYDNREKSKNDKRYVIGKKGIGKLAFFGISKNIIIETIQNNKSTSFEMDWDILKAESKETGKYTPQLLFNDKQSEIKQGTIITLSKIERKSNFDSNGLALSLARTFQVFDENDFEVKLFYNEKEIAESPIKNVKI